MTNERNEIREKILQILYDKYWKTRNRRVTLKELIHRLDINKQSLKAHLAYLTSKKLVYSPDLTIYHSLIGYYRITSKGIDKIEGKIVKENDTNVHLQENNITKSKLFICYSHEDSAFVNKLIFDLKQFGTDIWIDYREIKLGDSLLKIISKAIENTPYFAVILSPDSVKSNWVQKELQIAMTQEVEGEKVKVLPVLYKKCDIPLFLRDKVYADFTDSKNYIKPLTQILHRLGWKII